ncbi:MAG: o-succinylbenzoate synthase [Actinomycetaceae bacterium]|nr:o-succinylbenzoate synthase [Actinomycetaceae bacterium]
MTENSAPSHALIEIDLADLSPRIRQVCDGIDRLLYYSIPLRNRFRRIDVRDGLLMRGAFGWAEVSPFWDYGPEESATWLRAGLAAAREQPLPMRRSHVPVNATVPVVSPQRAHDIVKESGGCQTVKVKVADPGSTLTDDCARIEAVRDALGASGKIRVDANAAWSVDEAVRAIDELNRAAQSGGADGLEYVEQPCAQVDELAQVRRRVNVAIAADESVRRASDPLAVARAGAADLVIVKVQPLGGTRRVIEVCADAGMPAVVSSALESSIGLSRGVECAAMLEELPYACGLATSQMFTADIAQSRVQPVGGAIAAELAEVDEERIGEPTHRDQIMITRWLTRLNAMAQVLADCNERVE